MARADMASASARSDSIKGLAQSIANPTYRRLLTAEPTLRRAVPALIIAFLLTIGTGAVVQVLDHQRRAIAEAMLDIDNVADFVAERFDRLAAAERGDAARRGTPFILVSADDRPEKAGAARTAGADTYLSKPFDAEALKTCMAEVLGPF